jgi:hypothetical protein
MTLILSGTDGLSDIDGSAATPAIRGTDANTGMFFPAADTIAFAEGGVEAVRFDSSGNVGIGTSSPVGRFSAVAATDNTTVAVFGGPSGNTSRGLRIATGIIPGVTSNNELAILDAQSNVGVPTMVFQTAGTERARITSDGTFRVVMEAYGSGVSNTNYGWELNQNGINPFINHATNGTGASTMYVFINDNGTVGSISTNGSATAYNVSSDYRLKENVQPMTGAITKIAALKPCTYTWKVDGSSGEGFIAHELQAVCPDAVTGEKDAVNEDGSIKPQGIDTSFLVATLTAAIQEQQTMIQELKAKVAALEAKG